MSQLLLSFSRSKHSSIQRPVLNVFQEVPGFHEGIGVDAVCGTAPALAPSKELMTVAMENKTRYVQHLFPLTPQSQAETAVYALADHAASFAAFPIPRAAEGTCSPPIASLRAANDSNASSSGPPASSPPAPSATGAAMPWPS